MREPIKLQLALRSKFIKPINDLSLKLLEIHPEPYKLIFHSGVDDRSIDMACSFAIHKLRKQARERQLLKEADLYEKSMYMSTTLIGDPTQYKKITYADLKQAWDRMKAIRPPYIDGKKL